MTTTFFLIAIRGTDENTTLYFQIGGNAAWMVPLVQWLTFVLLFVPLTRKMERHGADDVFRLLKLMWGPTSTRLVAGSLFFLLLALGALCFRPYVVMLSVMFYLRTPEHAVGLVLLLGGMYVASRGYKAIGRMGNMFFVYAMFFFVSLVRPRCHRPRRPVLHLSLLRSGNPADPPRIPPHPRLFL